MSTVGLVYDKLTDDVLAQIVRDLLILQGGWDFDVNDVSKEISPGWIASLGLGETLTSPDLYVVYKVGDTWPEVPNGSQCVKRDLKVTDAGIGLDPGPKVGYYLKPQGRTGSNLTERYLNRAYPKGRGVIDPLVMLLWS